MLWGWCPEEVLELFSGLWVLWSRCSRVVMGVVPDVGATRTSHTWFGSELVLTTSLLKFKVFMYYCFQLELLTYLSYFL